MGVAKLDWAAKDLVGTHAPSAAAGLPSTTSPHLTSNPLLSEPLALNQIEKEGARACHGSDPGKSLECTNCQLVAEPLITTQYVHSMERASRTMACDWLSLHSPQLSFSASTPLPSASSLESTRGTQQASDGAHSYELASSVLFCCSCVPGDPDWPSRTQANAEARRKKHRFWQALCFYGVTKKQSWPTTRSVSMGAQNIFNDGSEIAIINGHAAGNHRQILDHTDLAPVFLRLFLPFPLVQQPFDHSTGRSSMSFISCGLESNSVSILQMTAGPPAPTFIPLSSIRSTSHILRSSPAVRCFHSGHLTR